LKDYQKMFKIATLLKHKEKTMKEKEHNLHLKIPISLDRALQALADMRLCSKAAIIRELIKREVEAKNL
jgi:hypothetical protein